eukprot:CAMPEP_0184656286 /NCGR_PEP_ID=MMETSP0308-20130426/16229_1 /TAXON_ID=38269 /ORGANISM="Gloeochaete witrockiana, Strain SAG 46.84" /LENGTH=93 /DNA_ID=CAMNT_0027093335 /DNA_START=97 /DNA_END=378 /DNA_ORIENTATION=-
MAKQLPGAPVAINTVDNDVKEAADFAIGEINKMSNSLTPSFISNIVSAQKQVVAGLNFLLTLELGPKSQMYDVVVYRDLQGKFSLSNFKLSGR